MLYYSNIVVNGSALLWPICYNICMKIIIKDKKRLDAIITRLKNDGLDNLHILADFDRTLTYGSRDNKKTPSIISVLRNGNYLSPDYAAKAHALFDKYHPIEINEGLPLSQRKEAMSIWWRSHKQLLIDSGLNKKDIYQIVKDRSVQFRQGVDKFLDSLHKNNVPLIILSAGGVGEAVKIYFENAKKDYKNIYYITNSLEWDKDGNAKTIIEPIIHSLNKDETIIKEISEIYEKIANRKNVILLGDNIADIDMVTGFDYDNLIKIGFLNYDTKKLENYYSEKFDIVLAGDGDFDYVNKLLKKIS